MPYRTCTYRAVWYNAHIVRTYTIANTGEDMLLAALAYLLGLVAYARRALSACSRLASHLLDQAGWFRLQFVQRCLLGSLRKLQALSSCPGAAHRPHFFWKQQNRAVWPYFWQL